jgi:hypothetical protein
MSDDCREETIFHHELARLQAMSETKTLDVCPKCRRPKRKGLAKGSDECLSESHWQSPECRIRELEQENARLRQRLLTAAGDDLCRLSQEEIKAMSLGTVQIPPKEEFLSSCERFHAQMVGEVGAMTNCLTTAQLIAENEKQRQEAEWLKESEYNSALHTKEQDDRIAELESALAAERERVAKAVEACVEAACKRAEAYLTLGVKLGDENRAAALLDTLKLRAVALDAGEAKGGG